MYVLVWPYLLKQYLLYINIKTICIFVCKSILGDNVKRQSAHVK